MRITLPSGTPAEIARPSTPSTTPTMGLVIAPDIFGLRPLYDDLVARIAAEQGWVVCAAEPFPGRDLPADVEPRFATVPQIADDDLLRDLQLAAEATGCARVGLLGFCMGGMYAFKAAGRLGRDVFARAVAFYGMIKVPTAWQGAGHREPLEELQRPNATPVLAIIGGRDHYTPDPDVEALDTLGGVEVVRYPDAEHGFAHDASRPTHRAEDAADAFARAWRFLQAG